MSLLGLLLSNGLLSACALQVLTPELTVTPSSAYVIPGEKKVLSATGGNEPYIFTLHSGPSGATINSVSGEFVATAPGQATIRVYDAGGQSADATLTVISPLVSTPSSITIPASAGASYTFSASGGIPPYTYELSSGPGSIDRDSGHFVAGNYQGDAAITITDSIGKTASTVAHVTRTLTDGTVFSSAISGNSLFLGGSFRSLNPTKVGNVFEVDASTGEVDYGFDLKSGFNGGVQAVVVSGNTAFFGGGFTLYQGKVASYLAKIDLTTGKIDPTFPNYALNGPVYALAQVGSALYVGGDFTTYFGLPARGIAKIDAQTGELDPTFTQSTGFTNLYAYSGNGSVYSIQSVGGSLYIGGYFTHYRGSEARGLVKIHALTGNLDSAFSPSGKGFNSAVNCLLATSDALYVGGNFTQTVSPSSPALRLAKVDLTTGALDTSFTQSQGFDGTVSSLLWANSGIYVGGSFANYRGTSAPLLVKLDPSTGNLDTLFTSPSGGYGLSSGAISSLLNTENGLIAGGNFNRYRGNSVSGIMRLDPTTGTFDPSFSRAGTWGTIASLTPMGSRILVAGNPNFYRGFAAERIGKLSLADLTAETGFSAAGGFNGSVHDIVVQGSSLFVGSSDSYYFDGSRFTQYRGTSVSQLVKLDASNGNLDGTFSAPSNIDVLPHGLLHTSQGIFISGYNYRARVDATTGGLLQDLVDPCYVYDPETPTPAVLITGMALSGNQVIYAGSNNGGCDKLAKFDLSSLTWTNYTAPAAGHQLIVQGSSVYMAAISAPYLLKLNLSDLSQDTTFVAGGGPDGAVNTMLLAPDGLYVGGAFSQYRGASAPYLIKVDPVTGGLDPSFSRSLGLASSPYALSISGTALFAGDRFLDLLTGALSP